MEGGSNSLTYIHGSLGLDTITNCYYQTFGINLFTICEIAKKRRLYVTKSWAICTYVVLVYER